MCSNRNALSFKRRGSCPAGILTSTIQITSSDSNESDDIFNSESQKQYYQTALNQWYTRFGFFSGLSIALFCNMLVTLIAAKNILKWLASIVDFVFISLFVISYFAMLSANLLKLSLSSISVQYYPTIEKCTVLLFVLFTCECITTNLLKIPIILSTTCISLHLLALFNSDLANVLLTIVVCIIRTFAIYQFHSINIHVRPYFIYSLIYIGILCGKCIHQINSVELNQFGKKKTTSKRRLRVQGNGGGCAQKKLINCFVDGFQNQIKRSISQTHNTFSVSSTEIAGTVISNASDVKTKRTLMTNLKHASSHQDIHCNTEIRHGTQYSEISNENKVVHFQHYERTSDYETGPDSTSILNANFNLYDATEELDLPNNFGIHTSVDILKSLPHPVLHSWHFDIFDYFSKDRLHAFNAVTYHIFQKVGLFDAFNIPLDKFFRFLSKVYSGYHDNPYHNIIHITDVLHTCFYLTTSDIRLPSTYDVDYKADTEIELPHFKKEKNCIGARLLPIEVFATFLAAIVHDLDHPGLTNKFLIKCRHKLAILYNDRSVLENHHAAEAWALILSSSSFNFLCNLKEQDFDRLRFLVVELILATDLAKHNMIVDDFHKQTSKHINQPKIEWSNSEERLLVCKMIIKIADVATPCKPLHIYLKWARCVQDEFYLQGDDEKAAKMSVSEYMDRCQPDEITLQLNFIATITNPTIHHFDEAGLLTTDLITNKSILQEKLHYNQNFMSLQSQQGNTIIPSLPVRNEDDGNPNNFNENF
ncbi:hypothetical protein GJ496_011957 [Pomphorhynchus laevis]|nr:hypothetical protein GJ496_011957 [Pomphorhynchus laevis]